MIDIYTFAKFQRTSILSITVRIRTHLEGDVSKPGFDFLEVFFGRASRQVGNELIVRYRGGGGKIGKLMEQKKPKINSVGWKDF